MERIFYFQWTFRWIKNFFTFVHKNMERIIYFQGTFCRIREIFKFVHLKTLKELFIFSEFSAESGSFPKLFLKTWKDWFIFRELSVESGRVWSWLQIWYVAVLKWKDSALFYWQFLDNSLMTDLYKISRTPRNLEGLLLV